MNKKAIIFLGALLATLIMLVQTLFIVPETKQVLVLQFGKPVRQVTAPGLNARIPFIQQLKFYEKRVLGVDLLPQEVILGDKKRLIVDSFVRYRIDDMLEFRRNLRTENGARERLFNVIDSGMRNVLSNVGIADLLSDKRSEIMVQIHTYIRESTKDQGLDIVDVRIKRTDFPQENREQVYRKMREERQKEATQLRAEGQELSLEITSNADRQKTVLVAEAQKKSQQLRGQGDEKAIEVYANAFNKDAEFYAFYRSLEAYRKTLANPETTLVISPDSEFFKYFGNIKSSP